MGSDYAGLRWRGSHGDIAYHLPLKKLKGKQWRNQHQATVEMHPLNMVSACTCSSKHATNRRRHCIPLLDRKLQVATLHIRFRTPGTDGDIAFLVLLVNGPWRHCICMYDWLCDNSGKIHDYFCVSFLTWAYTKCDRSEQNEAQSSFDDFQVGPGGDIAYTWCKAYDAWRHCIYISSCINGFAYKDWWFND